MDAKLRGIEEKATDILDRLGKISNAQDGNQNVVSFQLGTGGAAVWGCVTLFLMLTVINVVLAFTVLDMSRRLDRVQDYMNAIHQQAPWLRPNPPKE